MVKTVVVAAVKELRAVLAVVIQAWKIKDKRTIELVLRRVSAALICGEDGSRRCSERTLCSFCCWNTGLEDKRQKNRELVLRRASAALFGVGEVVAAVKEFRAVSAIGIQA